MYWMETSDFLFLSGLCILHLACNIHLESVYSYHDSDNINAYNLD